MQVHSYVSERQKQRKKRRIYFYVGATILGAYLVAFGIFWIMLRSPLLRADNVVVEGNQSVPDDAVVSLLQAAALPPAPRPFSFRTFFGFRNMIMWPDEVSSKTLRFIPQLESLSINKSYFTHTITATVTERQAIAIWCFMPKGSRDEECYWFDKTGTMFDRTFDTQGSLITVVRDYSQNPGGLNQEVLSDAFASNMISILQVIKQAGLNVKSVKLNDLSLQEIDVTTNNGPDLYFSLRFPALNYLPVIQSLMRQGGFSKIQYIDCRTENRVYYK